MASTVMSGTAATPAEGLRDRLAAVASEGKTLFGHHDDPVYGHTWCGDTGRSDVLEVTGRYPAIFNWDMGCIELGSDKNLDGVSFDRMRQEAQAQHRRGGINSFSWHPRHPLTGVDSWTTADKNAVSSMVNTPEGREAYNRQLDNMIDFFLSLTDDAGNRIPIVFRPWHEHTGSWFWWGADNCSPDDYKKLWHMMRERFDSRGVDNVVWAYSPDRCRSVEQYMERYPGDEYVDIMGADVYHFNGADGVAEYLDAAPRTLAIAAMQAEKRGKLVALTETGSESVPMARWYTDVLLPVLGSVPVCYVTVWRNAHDNPKHFYTPYPGHPAAENFKEFSNIPNIIFVDK